MPRTPPLNPLPPPHPFAHSCSYSLILLPPLPPHTPKTMTTANILPWLLLATTGASAVALPQLQANKDAAEICSVETVYVTGIPNTIFLGQAAAAAATLNLAWPFQPFPSGLNFVNLKSSDDPPSGGDLGGERGD